MWHHPAPQEFNYNEFKSTFSEIAFTYVTTFLGKWFLEEIKILKIFLYIFICKKFPSHYDPHPFPMDHDLNTLESTLPEVASTKVSAFLAK